MKLKIRGLFTNAKTKKAYLQKEENENVSYTPTTHPKMGRERERHFILVCWLNTWNNEMKAKRNHGFIRREKHVRLRNPSFSGYLWSSKLKLNEKSAVFYPDWKASKQAHEVEPSTILCIMLKFVLITLQNLGRGSNSYWNKIWDTLAFILKGSKLSFHPRATATKSRSPLI